MHYTITDTPTTVKVKNLSELISIMRSTSIFFSGQTNAEFMKGYAQRAKVVSGITIDHSSEEAFVKSCIEHGFIIKGKIEVSNKK